MISPRVCVIRLSSLGDVVLTTPVFQNLAAAWPGAKVTVLTKKAFAPVLEGHPQVEEIVSFESKGFWGWAREIRRRRFDWVLDLHDTFRSRLWSAFSGAGRCLRYDKRTFERRRLVGSAGGPQKKSSRLSGTVVDRYLEPLERLSVPTVHRIPRLYLKAGEILSPSWEARLGPHSFLALAPGAAHATKRWLPERFAQTADVLAREGGCPVVLLGAPSDTEAAEAVLRHLTSPAQNLVGQTSVREMMLILRRARGLLTNDSGAMHVAAALEVPTVAFFGPTVEAFGFFPQGPRCAVVEAKGLDCRPCSLHGSSVCPRGHFRCMKEVTVEAAVAAARGVMK